MPREVPLAAVDLIKRFEGYHRALPDGRAAPYLCPANVWTVAWGATRGLDAAPVSRETPPVTRAEGEQLLARDLRQFGGAVERLVTAPLTDNQFGALVSFAFNLGAGRLRSSTLLRRLNERDHTAAADEFPKWAMAGGRRLPGLVARREAERALFLAPDPRPPEPPIAVPARARDTAIGRFMAAFQQARAGGA